MKSKRNWIILVGAVLLLTIAGVAAAQVLTPNQTAASAFQIAEVKTITAVSSVETTGAVEAAQSAALFWQTTGKIATVNVKPGEVIKVGEVLMTLDRATAPSSVIMAQADLFIAQKALAELTHPTPLMIANTRNAVAEAQVALDKARKELNAIEHPAGPYLQTALSDAKLALDTAKAELQLVNASSDVQAYYGAVTTTDEAFTVYQQAKAEYDRSNKASDLLYTMKQAQAAYQAALAQQQVLSLRIGIDQATKADRVAKSEKKYDQATANLNAAQQGPSELRVTLAQSKVAVVEAGLSDTQAKLDKLIKGAEPNEVAAAQARVLAAQAAIDSLAIIAPFDGEIIAVNYQPGDIISPALAAVEIANRSELHILIQVNESDISQLNIGDAVNVIVKPLGDLELPGEITQINPRGVKVQGLVKYLARINLTETDPGLLLGMTADVTIVTNTQPNVLAVPFEAVQLDSQGEFVNRFKVDGTVERVSVTSGQLQGDVVVVEGLLQPGDKIEIVNPVPASGGTSLLNPSP